MGKTERSKWAGAHESMRARSEFQKSVSSVAVRCSTRKFVTAGGDCGFHELESAGATLAMCEHEILYETVR